MCDKNKLELVSTKHLLAWIICGLFGLILILIGAYIKYPDNRDMAIYAIMSGLGISFIVTAFSKILTVYFDAWISGHVYEKHMEIFAEKRFSAEKKYQSQNDKIQKSLYLMSVSANNAIEELKKGNRLYKAMDIKGADIQLLIIDPSSCAARQQANADRLSHNDELNPISRDFKRIDEIHKHLINDTPRHGSLEIRLMEEHPLMTLYIRDNETCIFGHYFPECRGDSYAAIRIERNWNKNVFDQYAKFFYTKWIKSEQSRLLIFKKGDDDPISFDQMLYNQKLESCESMFGNNF